MGFLSRLLGRSVERATENVIRDAVNNITGNAVHNANTPAQNANIPEPVQNNVPEPVQSASGFSWGENMPAEENQFNSGLPYYQYFDKVLREGFPGYEIRGESVKDGAAAIFTFTQGGRDALVVEVMSDSSEAQKVRRSCQAAGTPYLRFYHNHDGWWNTKAYVLSRVKGVLGA